MRRRALRQRGELPLARAAQLGEAIVVQEPGVVQRRDQAARGVPTATWPDRRAIAAREIAFVLLAVEAAETAREQRRNQQRHLREPERIADDQSRAARAPATA